MQNSYYMQHMLLQYGRQLTTARRLARHKHAMRLAQGVDDGPSPEQKRMGMVSRITREIIENMLLTGSDNPVVQEVKDRLNQELGEEFTFSYPPGELDMRIFRQSDAGFVEVSADEKVTIMAKLWAIAQETVDASML